MKRPIVFLLCFTLTFINTICLADPNLSDTENFQKGSLLHQKGQYQDAYDLYFKDLSPTAKNKKWLGEYKEKFLGDMDGMPTLPPLNIGTSAKTGSQCSMGIDAAKIDSQAVGGGNMVGGFFFGVFLGLIGTVIGWAVAGPAEPNATLLLGKSEEYKNCYTTAYLTETKSRKKSKALVGGLLGTACILVVYFAATSGD